MTVKDIVSILPPDANIWLSQGSADSIAIDQDFPLEMAAYGSFKVKEIVAYGSEPDERATKYTLILASDFIREERQGQ